MLHASTIAKLYLRGAQYREHVRRFCKTNDGEWEPWTLEYLMEVFAERCDHIASVEVEAFTQVQYVLALIAEYLEMSPNAAAEHKVYETLKQVNDRMDTRRLRDLKMRVPDTFHIVQESIDRILAHAQELHRPSE